MNAEIDLTNVVLKTERLTLRMWQAEDVDDLFEYASVPGVGEMAGWAHHADPWVSQTVINHFIEGKKTFALVYYGKVIGSLGVENYNEKRFPEFAEKRCCELGFVLSKTYWGQGLMPEAVNEVLRWLFEEKDVEAVFCGHFMRNSRSARVQEKCGFRHYAYGKFETRIGTVEDDEVEIQTREDWEKNRRAHSSDTAAA